MKISTFWFIVLLVLAFVFGAYTAEAQQPPMVLSSSITYKTKTDGKPNPFLFGVMATVSLDVSKFDSANAVPMLRVEQNTTSEFVQVNTRRELRESYNTSKVLAFLDGETDNWKPFDAVKLKNGGSKLPLNKRDRSFNLGGKETRYQIDGYLVYDPKTKSLSQDGDVRISYYDSLAKQTVKRDLSISGSSNQFKIKMIHEGAKYSLFDSHLNVNTRKVTEGEQDMYVTEFSGMNVPPSLLAAVLHWWGTAVFPFAD